MRRGIGWWGRRAAALVGAAVVGGWLASLAAVWAAARRDGADAARGCATAIIVLGAAQYDGRPSPVLKARLDHAVDLWRERVAPRVIVTGGRRAGDRTTEAAASRRYVVSQGVPDSAVLLESEGQTTEQSLRAAAALLRQLDRTANAAAEAGGTLAPPGLSKSTSRSTAGDSATPSTDGPRLPSVAVLVSDPFHMLRLGVLARRYGITAYGSPTPTSPISAHPRIAWSYLVRESLKVPVTVLWSSSDRAASDRAAPDRAASDRASPDRAASERPTPDRAPADHSPSDHSPVDHSPADHDRAY